MSLSTIVYSEPQSAGVTFDGRGDNAICTISSLPSFERICAVHKSERDAGSGYDRGHGYFPAMWKMRRATITAT